MTDDPIHMRSHVELFALRARLSRERSRLQKMWWLPFFNRRRRVLVLQNELRAIDYALDLFRTTKQ